jgi:hypothetical protein
MVWLLLLWFLLSVPAGLLFGRGIAAANRTLAAVDAGQRVPPQARARRLPVGSAG